MQYKEDTTAGNRMSTGRSAYDIRTNKRTAGLLPRVDYSTFARHGNGRIHGGTGMDSPARTACWATAIVTYGQRAGL